MDYITLNDRTLVIPKSLASILAVKGDHETKTVHFKIPKTHEEIDLSTYSFYINYLNAENEGDVYHVEDAHVDRDDIVFSWILSSNVLKSEGNIHISIRALGEQDRVWGTTIATLYVGNSLNCQKTIYEKDYDFINQQFEKLEELTKQLNDFMTINRKVRLYNTTEEMLTDRFLKTGDKTKTFGYSAINDGGESEFIIEELNESKLQIALKNGLFATFLSEIPKTAQCPSKFNDMLKLYEKVIVNSNVSINNEIIITDEYKLKLLTSEKCRTYRIDMNAPFTIRKSNIAFENLWLNGNNQTNAFNVSYSYITIKNNKLYNFNKAIYHDKHSYCVNLYIEFNEIGYCQTGIELLNESAQSFSNLIIENNYIVKNGNDADNMSTSGDSTSHGCIISSCANSSISKNTFEYNAGYGLYIKGYSNIRIDGLNIYNNYFENNKICNMYLNLENGVFTNNNIGLNYYSNVYDDVSNTLKPRNMNGINTAISCSSEAYSNSNELLDFGMIQTNMFDAKYFAENNINYSEFNILDKSNNCLNFDSHNKLSVKMHLGIGKYRLSMHFINPIKANYLVLGSGPGETLVWMANSWLNESNWLFGEFEIKESGYYRLLEQMGHPVENLSFDACYCIPI